MQPKAFVEIEGGDVSLENVNFSFVHTNRQNQPGGVILQTGSCGSVTCGTLSFSTGSVKYLNNGVGYISGLYLAPFIYASNLLSITIDNVQFNYNFVVNAYQNPALLSENSLIYLENFYYFTVTNCEFRNSLASGGMIVVNSFVTLPRTRFPDKLEVISFQKLHILLANLTFDFNLGENSIIHMKFSGDVLNVDIRNVTFANGSITGKSIVALESELESTGEIAFGSFEQIYNPETDEKEVLWLAPRHLSISQFSMSAISGYSSLLYLRNLANIMMSNISIQRNGNIYDSSMLAIYQMGYRSNPEVIAILTPRFAVPLECSSAIWTDGTRNVTIHSIHTYANHCATGSCGVVVSGNFGPTRISDYLAEENKCNSDNGLAIHSPDFINITMERVVVRRNTNTDGEMGVFKYGAVISITDSECSDNTGVYGTCFYLYYTQSFTSQRVTYQRNTAVESIGGALTWSIGNLHPLLIDIEDCTFSANSAIRGGAMSMEAVNSTAVKLTINRCIFVENRASMYGAGVYIGQFLTFIEESSISQSTFKSHNSSYGVVHLQYAGGRIDVTNCEFRGNRGSQVTALLIETEPAAFTKIRNGQFRDNVGGPTILKSNSRTNSTFATESCWFEGNPDSDIVVEGGMWFDSNSTYLNSHHSDIRLSSGSRAQLTSALLRGHHNKDSGGAVHVMTDSRLVCVHCVFINNTAGYAGGAVFSEQGSTVLLQNCVFRNNTATGGGSVIYVTSSQDVESTVESSIIEGNNGGEHSMLFVQSAKCTLRNVTVRDNPGTIYSGITVIMGSVTIESSVFSAMSGVTSSFLSMYSISSAYIVGTAFSDGEVRSGGHLYLSLGCSLTVVDSSFTRMRTTQNGGLIAAFSDSVIALRGVTAIDVQSPATGSLLSLSESSATVLSSTFADYSFGGISISSSKGIVINDSAFTGGQGLMGAALYCLMCEEVNVARSKFVRQSAEKGGAIYIESAVATSVVILDCEFVENSADTGGAIFVINARASVMGTEYRSNSAVSGGAAALQCTDTTTCSYSITNSSFIGNTATLKGGAIVWTAVQPSLSYHTFLDNTAQYGNDIASFSTALEFELTAPSRFLAEGVEMAPGQVVTFAIAMSLRDHYGQRITTDNSSICAIESQGTSSVAGTTKVTATSGAFVFDSFLVYARPNSTVQLTFTATAISEARSSTLSLPLTVRIRDCVPGEAKSGESCTVCSPGTYSLQPNSPCQTCPANAECFGNFTVVPRSGYWRSGMYSPVIRKCPNSGACLGGLVENTVVSLTGKCATGYKGNLCQSCENNYSRTGKNRCGQCPSRVDNTIKLSFISVAIILALAVMVWSTMRSATRPAAIHSVMIRIFVNYTQLVLLVVDFKLRWPAPVLHFFEVQESVGGATEQAYSVDCLLAGGRAGSDSYFRKIDFMALLPVPLILGAVCFWLAVSIRRRNLHVMKRECAATIVIIYFLILPSLVKSLFSVFSCTEIEPGEYWLTVDMDIRCWDYTHNTNIYGVCLPAIIAWVFAVPCICLGILTRFRRKFNEIWLRLQYGFLINGYKRRCFYWEFVILYRKILIICCAVFLNYSIQIQALTVQLILLLAFFLQYNYAPFKSQQLNTLEMWAICVADITIYCGLYYLTDDITEELSWVLFLLLLVANATFIVYWATGLLRHFITMGSARYPWFGKIFRPGHFVDSYMEKFIKNSPNYGEEGEVVARLDMVKVYRFMIEQNVSISLMRRYKYSPRCIKEVLTIPSIDC